MQTGEYKKQQSRIQNLYQWLSQGKSIFPKLAIEIEAPGKRNVVSIKPIKKGETLVFIPKDQIISLETTKDSQIIQNILKQKLKFHSPKHCLLAVYLLEQKANNNSKFKSYIEMLPTTCTNFPIFYSQQQMKQLKGSPLFEAIEQRKIQIQSDYKSLIQKDIGINISYDDFCWARMVVCSRIFGIIMGDQKTDALVPLADMLNHGVIKQTIWSYSNMRQGFVIQAQQHIPRGVQIFDSYGRKSNSRFLLNYGFVIESNESDEIQIKLRIDRKLKTKLMQICEQDPCKFVFKLGIIFDNNSFQDLLSTVRFILEIQKSPDLQQQQSNKTTFRQPTDAFTNFQSEKKCWQYINSIFTQMLDQYPTSINDDMKLLEIEKNMSFNRINCIKLRIGQKRIIQYYIDICKQMTILFSLTQRNFKRISKKKVYKQYQDYLSKISSLLH